MSDSKGLSSIVEKDKVRLALPPRLAYGSQQNSTGVSAIRPPDGHLECPCFKGVPSSCQPARKSARRALSNYRRRCAERMCRTSFVTSFFFRALPPFLARAERHRSTLVDPFGCPLPLNAFCAFHSRAPNGCFRDKRYTYAKRRKINTQESDIFCVFAYYVALLPFQLLCGKRGRVFGGEKKKRLSTRHSFLC